MRRCSPGVHKLCACSLCSQTLKLSNSDQMAYNSNSMEGDDYILQGLLDSQTGDYVIESSEQDSTQSSFVEDFMLQGSNELFFDDVETNTFGKRVLRKKSIQLQPSSDFRFNLKTKVICETNPTASGYVIELFMEKLRCDPQVTPLECYFTSESVHRKVDFMKSLNRSSGVGGLTCSLIDRDITMYFQHKKRESGVIPVKKAVPYVGRHTHENIPVWVLGRNFHIDVTGNQIDETNSEHIWIGHLVEASKIATNSSQLDICLPLGEQTHLQHMVMCLEKTLKHNFSSGLLALGAAAMGMHYGLIMKEMHCCPVPFLTGQSGTGKTTALKSALSLFGGQKSRFFSRGSKESYALHCCQAGIPIGCDDPSLESDAGQIAVDLYNGAKITTIKRGDSQPLTTALFSANFNLSSHARYVSRLLLIVFSLPEIGANVSSREWKELVSCWEKTSSVVGSIIALEKVLVDEGFVEIESKFFPRVEKALVGALPRVVPGYALLLWFTSKIVTLAGKPQLMDLVWNSFEDTAEVLSKLQPAQKSIQTRKQCSLKDCLAEVIGSMRDVDPKNIQIFGKVETFDGIDVLSLRYEDLPTPPSFSKKEFLIHLPERMRNQKRTLAGLPKKAALIPLEGIIPGQLDSILQVFPDARKKKQTSKSHRPARSVKSPYRSPRSQSPPTQTLVIDKSPSQRPRSRSLVIDKFHPSPVIDKSRSQRPRSRSLVIDKSRSQSPHSPSSVIKKSSSQSPHSPSSVIKKSRSQSPHSPSDTSSSESSRSHSSRSQSPVEGLPTSTSRKLAHRKRLRNKQQSEKEVKRMALRSNGVRMAGWSKAMCSDNPLN